MNGDKTDRLYSDEISLFAEEEFSDFIRLNLKKIEEYRKSFDIPFIGISGSEGKTTTKRMISSILSTAGKTLETPLDCSTTSGVTSTLLKLNKDHNFAILELGILNPKQFEYAIRIARPNIAALTNIGEAHMASLGDKYTIANTNVELIRRLPSDGFAILNIDDELVSGMEKISPTPRVIKFGLNPGAHFFASNIRFLGPEGTQFEINKNYKFHLKIFGSASIYNALAAISVARALNFDFDVIRKSLEEKFEMLAHRGNLIQADDIYILDHSYDATINSIHKSCESLVQFKSHSEKLILVIGHIGNLGQKSKAIHLNLGYYLSALPIDTIITIGEEAKGIADGIRKINHTRKHIESISESEALSERIINHLEPNSTLLVIGNKSLKLNQTIDELILKIKSSQYSGVLSS